jgi:hypothetical protein
MTRPPPITSCPDCDAPPARIAENCNPDERARAYRDYWLTYCCEDCGHQWEPAHPEDARR